MIDHELLRDTLDACELHHRRMMFAWERTKTLVPVDPDKYDQLREEDIGYFDQLIYRFSKLQDAMGNKLFRQILEGLGEETHNIPFIDILNKLEKLNILPDKDQWLALRELRNEVTHEYPSRPGLIAEGLNELHEQAVTLSNIWQEVKNYTLKRFHLTLP